MRNWHSKKIDIMTKGGMILSRIMTEAMEYVQAGKTTMQTELFVRERFAFYQVEPSFTKVRNYQYYTCLSVNDVVVHGVPNDQILVNGDIIGIDIGVFFQGFHTDMSWSKIIGGGENRFQAQNTFLKCGQTALIEAVRECVFGKRVGDISLAIQKRIENSGYHVVKQLVGHAVGRELHEFPHIPGIITKPVGKTEPLKPGMTLAIEIIYVAGNEEIAFKNNDGWSIATRDGSLSGLFEATIAVLEKGNKVLTPFTGLLNT